jgi:hypothetical protein
VASLAAENDGELPATPCFDAKTATDYANYAAIKTVFFRSGEQNQTPVMTPEASDVWSRTKYYVVHSAFSRGIQSGSLSNSANRSAGCDN